MTNVSEANGETSGEVVIPMFSDTQKGLAWFISISFVALIFVWVFQPPEMKPESMAQLNNLVSTLVNLVLLAFGYFLGSSRSSKDKDDSTNRVMEKLTSPPPNGPVSPVPSPAVVDHDPLWNQLTDEERVAITAAAATDDKIAKFVAEPTKGKPSPEDITYLTDVGLLKQARAIEILAK